MMNNAFKPTIKKKFFNLLESCLRRSKCTLAMSDSSNAEYERILAQAAEYHKKALWQEKFRALQEALVVSERPGFPQAALCKQHIFYDMAGIWRRLGQYTRAKEMLKESLDSSPDATSLFRASVLGELGVTEMQSNQYSEAQTAFREQVRLAREAPRTIEADAEICRAIGNEGMAALNLWQLSQPKDDKLIQAAFDQIRERISRAEALQIRIRDEAANSKYSGMAHIWEIIGRDRLSLCHLAVGETAEALLAAEESQRGQSREDPHVTGFSTFIYGNALWHNGDHESALKCWNTPLGTCSPAMPLCREPAAEHNKYLQLMATAGVNFDSFDEQGYTALDYAVLSDNINAKEAIPILESGLRRTLYHDIKQNSPQMQEADIKLRVDEEISRRLKQAELRRHYRTLLQEHIRPELQTNSTGSFKKLREIYAKYQSDQPIERRVFSNYQFVKYTDFKRHNQFPRSDSGLTTQYSTNKELIDDPDYFIVFISYRWIAGQSPDNNERIQWNKIISAVEAFLDISPDIHSDQLGLWLDYACIDQEDTAEMERGIDALPLAVLQCNAMISLLDETYYERAWCGVEVMLIQALVESYGLHQWWEYNKGSLTKGDLNRQFNMDTLKLTKEAVDRPKVDFLFRQSKLLGRG